MVEFPVDTHPGHSLHLLLFKDVTNSNELVEAMKAGTLSPELAFFTATLVPSTFPVLVAAHKALLAQSRDNLATRTLHSELIYNYSGSKHISEALRRFGINETSSYILVGRFDATPEDATRGLIQGSEINLEELSKEASQSLILKYYKITPAELEVSSLEEAVTCRIAARDIL
uniref:EKC/KEOPS complex subunit CGI121 n=1 Tax=Physcomitrium patens TaxID=3218 RepID=A0A7I4CLR6_PHYPA